MRERAAELRTAARRGARGVTDDGDADVRTKIAEMPEPDRSMAERIHVLITEGMPNLSPRTWYGMPAYEKDGNLVCFFQGAYKFKARYATLGFSDKANLDDGQLWPVAFAVTELTPSVEETIVRLVQQAAG